MAGAHEAGRKTCRPSVVCAPQADAWQVRMGNIAHALDVPAETESLETVTDAVGEWLEEQGFSMRDATQMAIAAEEIFVNICNYAYEDGDMSGRTRVEMTMLGDTAQIRFLDTGVPFNPLDVPEPDITLPAEERAIGGLGIHMVRSLVSSVSYEHADGNNVLTITKDKENA